jgi:hypothetical protein
LVCTSNCVCVCVWPIFLVCLFVCDVPKGYYCSCSIVFSVCEHVGDFVRARVWVCAWVSETQKIPWHTESPCDMTVAATAIWQLQRQNSNYPINPQSVYWIPPFLVSSSSWPSNAICVRMNTLIDVWIRVCVCVSCLCHVCACIHSDNKHM